MSKYIFNKDSNWWNKDENGSLESFLARQDGRWKESLEQFFSIPEIKEWVNANDWSSIFREWDDGYCGNEEHGLKIGEHKKYRRWIADVLALFLSLVNIDFMPYLSDIYVEHMFKKPNYE